MSTPNVRKQLEKIAVLLTKHMLYLVRHGRRVYDDKGFPRLDEQGQQVHTAPTAADLRVIITWLRWNRVKAETKDGDHREHLRLLADRAREVQLTEKPNGTA